MRPWASSNSITERPGDPLLQRNTGRRKVSRSCDIVVEARDLSFAGPAEALFWIWERECVVEKYDIKSDYKSLYSASAKAFSQVDIPELRYIAIDGVGDPNTSPDYSDAVQSLYAVAYTLKFASKASGRDFTVGPLEGLWWADDPSAFIRRDTHQHGSGR